MVMNKNTDYLNSNIPFNKPHITKKEIYYIKEAYRLGQLAGDGYFTKKCHKWLEDSLGCKKCLLTHSCTGALEMTAILANISVGDEVIMPSYTFVSTANAFVLRGGIPVFIDIRKDTLNINENLIEEAITKKTKAIMVVHYAGVACEMDKIKKIAKKHKLLLFEDAAQGLMSKYKNQYLGTMGDLGTYSFHETKNIISGEGGALLINNKKYIERAEIIREKGTNRAKFIRGQVDKYTWVDIGSSYLPGELISAFLLAQLEDAKEITAKRINTWRLYHELLHPLEKKGLLQRPSIPEHCEHNGHLYYILLSDEKVRNNLMSYLERRGVLSVFHYVPLHNSQAGRKYGRSVDRLPVTMDTWKRLVRLPMFYDLRDKEVEYIVSLIKKFFL